MSIRLNIILLLIVAVLSGWYLSQYKSDRTDLAHLVKREGEAEYRGKRVETMVYDLNGKPQYFAQAQAINRYESTGRTEFVQPLLNLFDVETAQKQWQIRADYAELSKDKILVLTGNVRLENLLQDARLNLIETEQLHIDLTTQDIQTERAVKTIGMGFMTTGIGLVGNLKKQIATLTRDVKTHIEPTVIKSKNVE